VTIELEGLDDVLDAIRRIPTTLGTRVVFEDVSQIFADRLRAATPPGYSGRLGKSVLWEADEDGGLVGFEEGVETAGNPRLESVLRPQTRGRSVLRWVSVDELETLTEEAFDAYAKEGVLYMERALADGIS